LLDGSFEGAGLMSEEHRKEMPPAVLVGSEVEMIWDLEIDLNVRIGRIAGDRL
jgi:hypothetical protein